MNEPISLSLPHENKMKIMVHIPDLLDLFLHTHPGKNPLSVFAKSTW